VKIIAKNKKNKDKNIYIVVVAAGGVGGRYYKGRKMRC
jgi:hypothetical protein